MLYYSIISGSRQKKNVADKLFHYFAITFGYKDFYERIYIGGRCSKKDESLMISLDVGRI